MICGQTYLSCKLDQTNVTYKTFLGLVGRVKMKYCLDWLSQLWRRHTYSLTVSDAFTYWHITLHVFVSKDVVYSWISYLNMCVFALQALMGIQLVVSLLAASIMQRMAPHCSFARWLICNGRYYTLSPLQSGCTLYTYCARHCIHVHVAFFLSLFRFKHPSEGELCALAGKQMPKQTRRDRWELGEGLMIQKGDTAK